MLDIFRKRGLSTVIYGAIIIAIILVFVIQFNPSAGKKTAGLKEACVAHVYGWCIGPNDLRASYRMLVPRDASPSATTVAMLKKVALDGLVERELLVHEAERIGITVTDDEVSDAILDGLIHVSTPSDEPQRSATLGVMDGMKLANFKDPKTKEFDTKVYERIIRNLTGRSATEFREEQSREIIAAKMRDLVRAPVRVSEPEALEKYVGEKSQARLTYVPISKAFVARYLVNPTDAQIADWLKEKINQSTADAEFDAHKKDSDPLPNHIRHILIKFNETGSAADKHAALAKISLAYARIKSGEAFADVARDLSQDPGSGAKGGDVGDKTDGFVPEFKKAADDLKPGEMTNEAIETQFGYHLIKKDDPLKLTEIETALRKDANRDAYVKAKSLEAAKAFAAKIQASMKDGKSADEAAKMAVDGIAKGAIVLEMPVRERAKEKEESADAGAVADAESRSTTDASVTTAKKNGKGADAVAKKIADPGTAITAQNDPDRPQAQTTSQFNQGGEPIEGLSGETAQKVAAFAFNGKDGDVMADPVRSESGFVVVQLKEHSKATKEQFDKDKDVYLQGMLALKQAEELAVYVHRLREEHAADIQVDESTYAVPSTDGGPGHAPDPEDEDQQP